MGDITGGVQIIVYFEPLKCTEAHPSTYCYTEYLLCTLHPALSSFCTHEPKKQLHLHYLLLPSFLITTHHYLIQRTFCISHSCQKTPFLVCTQILERGATVRTMPYFCRQIDGPGICLPCHVNEKSSSFRSTQPQNKADTILLKACVTKNLDLPYPVLSRCQETMQLATSVGQAF